MFPQHAGEPHVEQRTHADVGTRTVQRSDEIPQVGRPPRKLYRIGEVVEYSGLSRQTVHNYTVIGLIKEESRTKAGHRLYGEGVFAELQRIMEMRATHTLQQIREQRERMGGRLPEKGEVDTR